MPQETPSPNRKPLVDVAAEESRRLADDPNFLSMGVGLKLVRGEPQLSAALQYYVRAKAARGELEKLGTTMIPTEVGGYPTDVIQVEIAQTLTCPPQNPPTGDRGSEIEDPLVGGTSTTTLNSFHSFPTGYGTLGGICFDAVSGDAMALSNAHVYGDDIGAEGIQPWLPTDEYIGAAIKWLTCGGPLSHLFFWTAPSAATAILDVAAAAAWTVALAADAEDPSRWGQRTTTVPPAGALTERERVHLEAEVPHLPFPGRTWNAKTHWDYTRVATSGSTSGTIDEERPNEHALIGKRVFSDRPVYRGGERVRICAEMWTRARDKTQDLFVVAHCFPIADPSRITRRVLVPNNICGRVDGALEKEREQVCVHGFNAQIPGVAQMLFPVVVAPFRIWSSAPSTQIHGTSLGIPADAAIHIAIPPSTHVDLDVSHRTTRVRARAIAANGDVVDEASSTDEQGVTQKLRLTGPEMVRVDVEGGSGEGLLSSICTDKHRISVDRWKGRSTYHTGTFDLALQEQSGTWAVVVISQSMDMSPTGGDPIAAARRLGGVVNSANVQEQGECTCTLLFDHTFQVQ
ncbi:hypothetical protein [Arthrobacter sp. ES3-54]|uniref:hypothetical protein n=1 Tax=Arthrobacter sp. ES3-54 TaxID=1502991 RepID=UPI0024063A8A|nr:hypothetical protein [Arthrobacter sp. ES3-54]MDF9749202.1 hypothetical protein [Arthrobacter sp. ES3-54]